MASNILNAIQYSRARIGTFLFLSLAVLFLPLKADAEEGTLVLVKPLTFEQEEQRVDVVGSARAVRSVELFPSASDFAREVNIQPGTWVEEGALLLRLDDRRQTVNRARARIELADAERSYERLRLSREQGTIPQSDLDDAETQLELRRVELQQAEIEWQDRRVEAPFRGVVGITDVEPGDRVTEQMRVTTIDDRSSLFIDFRVPESALHILQSNPEVRVVPWQRASNGLEATIVEIDSRVDERSRMVRVRALLENEDDTFRPGMSFRVQMSARGAEYAVIPEAALMWGATEAFVWVVRQEGEAYYATRVDVEVRQRRSGRVLVAGDFGENETLIVEGVQSLRADMRLRFTDDSEFAQ